MKIKRFIPIISLLPFIANAQRIDDLGIRVTGPERTFAYTNKEAGTYHGVVNGKNSGGWQGWFINTQKIADDYSLSIGGAPLRRENAVTDVFPHMLVRHYPGAVSETLALADSIDALLITVDRKDASIEFYPAGTFRPEMSVPSSVSVRRWTSRAPPSPGHPSVIVLAEQHEEHRSVFAICAGTSMTAAESLAAVVSGNSDQFIAARKARMQAVLDRSPFFANDRAVTTALAWAKISLDALIMNQPVDGKRTRGIFAGLPWFNNYWGRDSFISLPGATYVTGDNEDARDILLTFAQFQQADSANADFGRIPNLATPSSVIYNTADGTPWFFKSLYEYVKYSGDTGILRPLYPVIRRAIDGTLRFHTDSFGFLVHGDAETWMDAVGPDGSWSPRGNRACDIQALWYHQLSIGTFIAEYLNEFSDAARWSGAAENVRKNFSLYFLDIKRALVYDHLAVNGTPSEELRPNQLFCFDMPIPEDIRRAMVQRVIDSLIFPYGTATLSSGDPNFHPYHDAPEYYVKDAAYHNGTVWTWLNGTAIYAATRYDLQDLIVPVTMNSVHQILDRGCVGTLSELVDAYPRPGTVEPRLSGTFSQAWSLAEFIRSVYQDYCGVSVDMTSRALRLNPKLPSGWNDVSLVQRAGTASLSVRYHRDGDTMSATVIPSSLDRPMRIDYFSVCPNGTAVTAPLELSPNDTLQLRHTSDRLWMIRNGNVSATKKGDPKIFLKNFSDARSFAGTALAVPDTQRRFPVLRGPSYPLLSHADVRHDGSGAALLFEASDPAGDDTGLNGTYRYPTSTSFAPGILDITRAEFRNDDRYLYCTLTFAGLTDPGWHPEYGYQLTFAAIALGTGNRRTVGYNSQYTLPATDACDRLIIVGGGIRVEDSEGRILCAYIPRQADASDPIGNVRTRTISFSIPLAYIGQPDKQWTATILAGAQDDHGGAGIGEFRSVGRAAGEWIGGGKTDASMPNVYDRLIITNP